VTRTASCPDTDDDSASGSVASLLKLLEHRGSAPALMVAHDDELQVLSSADLAARIRSVAHGLLLKQWKPDDAVLLLGPNGFDWVVARLAMSAAGLLAVPADDSATDAEVHRLIRQSGAKHIICPASRYEALTNNPSLDAVAFGVGALPKGAQRMEELLGLSEQILPTTSPDAAEMLAYTSGTTGSPKAIVLTNRNIETNVSALAASRLAGPGDRVLLPLPLNHVYPYVVGLLAALASGATVVFPQSTTGPQLLAAIQSADVTVIVGVPRLYTALCAGLTAQIRSAPFKRMLFGMLLTLSVWLRRSFGLNLGTIAFPTVRRRFGPNLRLLISGGARLDDETLWMLVGLGFDVRSGYGLAETASTFTANLPEHERWGSEGQAFAGAVRISAPDATGSGGIELKGPQVFPRYLENPQATAAAFTPDGWFRTGDVGRLSKDGFLYVSGRARDILVLGGGTKIDPEELERIYGTSRYIREIAIFERAGALAAVIVPSIDATRSGGAIHLDTAIRVDLTSRARELPSHQQLSGFAISREPLPRTRLGKYRRFLLPQIYERAKQHGPAPHVQLKPEDEPLLQSPTAARVYELLRKRYPDAPLGLDASPLLDLGIDSLEWVSFGLELDQRLGLKLTEADIASVASIRDLLGVAIRAATATEPPRRSTPNWIARPGMLARIFGALFYALDWLAMRLLFRLRVSGRETLPSGNAIVIANHTSYLDAPALGAALGYRFLRSCYWAGDPALLFAKHWQWPFMRALRVYPLDERQPSQALDTSSAILARGESLVWFPEGWRSPDGKLEPFLPGIGHLLIRRPVPVVPVRIDGTFEALPRDAKRLRLRPIRVHIGKPIFPDSWSELDAHAHDTPQKIASKLQEAVNGLSAQ